MKSNPKARAEAKFKMVGTKLNEVSLKQFEQKMEERGFENTSSYIRFLIDFDAIDSIEEERKQNEIMTKTIDIMRSRIKELEDKEKSYSELISKYGDILLQNNKILKLVSNRVVQEEKEGKNTLFGRLKTIFNI